MEVRRLGRQRKEVTRAIVADDTGVIEVIWWSGRYIARGLKQGTKVALSGKIDAFADRLQMKTPAIETWTTMPSTPAASSRSTRAPKASLSAISGQ